MSTIGYGYGSEWHLLRYLGYHREALNHELIMSANPVLCPPTASIQWLDFPWGKGAHLQNEKDWEGVAFIDDPQVHDAWAKFWPTRGTAHCWDAVGKIILGPGPDDWEYLLVEAKAHVDEILSVCGAHPVKGGYTRICNAFTETKEAMQIAHVSNEQWLSPYYQYCNRIAALHFLNNSVKRPTRLLFLYFTGEQNMHGRICPATAVDWQPHLNRMYNHIGLTGSSPLEQRIHKLFLPVFP